MWGHSSRMSRSLLLLAFPLLTLPLFAQSPYDHNLHTVTPDNGPVSGGTPVTIEGDLRFSGLADPCGGPRVFIGGAEAQVLTYDETAIQIVTPPYTAGTFDVTVNRCGAPGTMKNGFKYTAGRGFAWERVLLPVYLSADLPGAFGSVWRTTLAGYNMTSGTAVTGHPEYDCQYPSASAAAPCFQELSRGAFDPQIDSDHHQPGRLIYIDPAQDARRIKLNLRLRDVSREASSLGTELNPVFEDDAIGPFDSFVLLNVPLGEPYRQKLRIYRLDLGDPATVKLYFTEGSTDVAQRDLTMSSEPSTNGFLLYPGYAELDLDRVPDLAGHAHSDILISVPLGRYWGYVSITNNVTQQVTTVTP